MIEQENYDKRWRILRARRRENRSLYELRRARTFDIGIRNPQPEGAGFSAVIAGARMCHRNSFMVAELFVGKLEMQTKPIASVEMLVAQARAELILATQRGHGHRRRA